MNTSKRIAQNALLNTIKTVFGIAFPLVTFPYVSRVLGVEPLGKYNFGASIISYFLLIAGLGINTYGIREGTQYRKDGYALNKFVSEVFSINLMSTIIAYVLLVVCILCVPKIRNNSISIIILSTEIIATTVGVVWVCNIFEDFASITIRTIAFQIVSLIMILLLVKGPDDLYKYIGIIAFSNSGSSLVNCIYVRRKYCKFCFTTNICWKNHLRPILIIFSTTVAVTIYVSSDTTMLGFMTSDYYVGLYSTAVKIYSIIKNVLSSILVVVIPHFLLLFSKEDDIQTQVLFSRIFNILTLIMMPIITGLFMISEDVVILISGFEFREASTSLKLLSIAVMFSLYAFMYIQCILIPIKKENTVFKATLISAICNIVLNYVLIPKFGFNAAAFTTIVAELITFFIAYIEARQHIHLQGIARNTFSVCFGCVLIILICWLFKTIGSFWIRVFISLLGSMIIYIAVLFVSKNATMRDLLDLIGPKLTRKKR